MLSTNPRFLFQGELYDNEFLVILSIFVFDRYFSVGWIKN